MQPKNIYVLIVLLLTFILFWQKGIFGFLFTENIAGRDLIGNYAFTWLMHGFMENLSFSGWSSLWFAGFPVFDFYPPMFFITVNLLNFLTFGAVGLEASYRIIIFVSLFALPSVVFYSLRKMGFNEHESFFAALFSFGFLFLNGHYAAVHQTLNFGLVSQIFSINFLLLFFSELFKTKKNIFIAGVLLALVILSHPFIGFLAVLGLLVFFIMNMKERKNIFVIGAIGFVFSSWWIVNAFANMNYMNTYISQSISILNFPLIFIPFIFAGFKKSKNILFLFGLFSLSLFAGTSGLEFIHQPTRFFQYSLLFGMLLAGLGACRIYIYVRDGFLNSKTKKVILISIIIIPFMFSIIQIQVYKEWESDIMLDNLIQEIKNFGEGRILIESGMDNKEYYMLMEKIPIETGKPVLTELHTDSSISAPYTLALQYWISFSQFSNPICSLCNPEMKIDEHVIFSNLKKFNVKYIIVNREESKKILNKFPEYVSLNKKIDEYYIFETSHESKYYEIPKYEPILIISGFDDWKKLNEKLFIDKDLINLTFAWSGSETDADRFSQIFKIQKNETIENFYNRIKNNAMFIEEYNATITNFFFSDNKISFVIDSEKEVPVLLKFSYYPKWKSETKIYPANPSLMLVFGKGETEIFY